MASPDLKAIEQQDDDFESLFEQTSQGKRRRVEPGERVRGKVVFLGEKTATLDLGGGLEALYDLAGSVGPDGKSSIHAGDTVEGFVLRVKNRVIEVTRAIGRGMVNTALLEEAVASGVPIEGTVESVNKGGYVVDVSGTPGFCPMGQMDTRRIEDPATLIGQKFKFRVTEMRAGGREVVLSRRAMMEEEAAHRATETKKRLEVGARFTGTVTNIRDFGAFVDIGGIEGLVPASELAYGRVKVEDMVALGQQVEVEVVRLERDVAGKRGLTDKITLSMRALAQDPFEALAPYLASGTAVRGTVTRVEPFGAFVELVPGVEGLIHVSAFGRRITAPRDVVQAGQDVTVRVDSVDLMSRRISLGYLDPADLDKTVERSDAPAELQAKVRWLGRVRAPEPVEMSPEREAAAPAVPRAPKAPPPPPIIGSVHEVTVDRIEPFGVFVNWGHGRGLVPVGDLGLPYGADLRRAQPVGSSFKAVVLEVRPDGKIRLSKTAAQAAEERADAESFLSEQRSKQAQKGPVGSLGELLLQKLNQPRK